jgi:hypothetical protein
MVTSGARPILERAPARRRIISLINICCPAQLNIHFEGVSDHGDKHDLFFSGLSTFLKLRFDSVDTVQRHCWQCLQALVGVKEHQTKIPSIAIIKVNPRTPPTPSIIC